jgi:hypothetical protein
MPADEPIFRPTADTQHSNDTVERDAERDADAKTFAKACRDLRYWDRVA